MNLKDKIIALDIDGTITEDCTLPSLETCNEINRLINLGYNIVLMTGRGFATIKPIYDNCKMNTYVVVFNGSYVFNPTTNDVIKDDKFESNYFSSLVNNKEFMDCIDDIMIEYKEDILAINGHNCYGDQKTSKLDLSFNGNVYCINTKVKDPSMHKIVEEIVNKHPDYKYRYWYHLGEIYNTKITKKDGAELLLKHFNKTFDDLIFIGDSDNDVEILKAAGHGVAMKNATTDAKIAADEITKYDVKENGAIRHLLEMIKDR